MKDNLAISKYPMPRLSLCLTVMSGLDTPDDESRLPLGRFIARRSQNDRFNVVPNEEMSGGAKRSPLDLLVLPQRVDFCSVRIDQIPKNS